METKHVKQRKRKQNHKQALSFLKAKNPQLETLVKVFDLRIDNSKLLNRKEIR